MQKSRSIGVLLCAAILFLVFACNNEEQKAGTETSTDTSTAKSSDQPATTPVVTNTIVTGPTSMMILEQKVADFDKWLAAYESNDSMRMANGIHKYVVGRGEKDPNMVFIAQKVDDIAKAKEYSKSAALKQRMKMAGVVGTPSFTFAIINYLDTSVVTGLLRSRTTFTVKDWKTWESVFNSNKAALGENGLILRAYGHDADNDKKVTMVTAISDTAKAFAYWKSDVLKKRRAESGVIGEPNRFVFRMVKRY